MSKDKFSVTLSGTGNKQALSISIGPNSSMFATVPSPLKKNSSFLDKPTQLMVSLADWEEFKTKVDAAILKAN